MKPWWIAIAVAIAAVVVAAFLWLPGDDARTGVPTTAHSPPAAHRPPTTDHRPPTTETPATTTDLSALARARGVAEVRDHRGGAVSPADEPVGLPPPPVEGGPRMDVAVVAQVSRILRPIVLACSASIPDAERSDQTSIQVRMTTSIANGAFAVETLTTDLRGGIPAHPEVVDCIAKRATVITVATEKHADLYDYALTFPYRLKPKS